MRDVRECFSSLRAATVDSNSVFSFETLSRSIDSDSDFFVISSFSLESLSTSSKVSLCKHWRPSTFEISSALEDSRFWSFVLRSPSSWLFFVNNSSNSDFFARTVWISSFTSSSAFWRSFWHFSWFLICIVRSSTCSSRVSTRFSSSFNSSCVVASSFSSSLNWSDVSAASFDVSRRIASISSLRVALLADSSSIFVLAESSSTCNDDFAVTNSSTLARSVDNNSFVLSTIPWRLVLFFDSASSIFSILLVAAAITSVRLSTLFCKLEISASSFAFFSFSVCNCVFKFSFVRWSNASISLFSFEISSHRFRSISNSFLLAARDAVNSTFSVDALSVVSSIRVFKTSSSVRNEPFVNSSFSTFSRSKFNSVFVAHRMTSVLLASSLMVARWPFRAWIPSHNDALDAASSFALSCFFVTRSSLFTILIDFCSNSFFICLILSCKDSMLALSSSTVSISSFWLAATDLVLSRSTFNELISS